VGKFKSSPPFSNIFCVQGDGRWWHVIELRSILIVTLGGPSCASRRNLTPEGSQVNKSGILHSGLRCHYQDAIKETPAPNYASTGNSIDTVNGEQVSRGIRVLTRTI